MPRRIARTGRPSYCQAMSWIAIATAAIGTVVLLSIVVIWCQGWREGQVVQGGIGDGLSPGSPREYQAAERP